MNSLKIIKNNRTISLYGSNAIIEKEKKIIEKLELSGIESNDRLIIQKCIDENKLKSDILYEGNTIYPFEKIVKEYRKLQMTNSLKNLSNDMYNFFTNACGDIAHYNKQGYRAYYNDSIIFLENSLLKYSLSTPRFSDIDKIFKEIKIGKYFDERENINIDKVSLNSAKKIIKECGWTVTNTNGIWKIERTIMDETNFNFEVNCSDGTVSNLVKEIQKYYDAFCKDDYIENKIIERKSLTNPLSVSQIIGTASTIKRMLGELSEKILYNCRVIAENKKDDEKEINQNYNNIYESNVKNNNDFDYDFI